MPFKFNASRRHPIPKQRHRVTNWAEYDAALRQRGSLTVWFSEDAIAAWRDSGETGGGHWCGFALTPLNEVDGEPVYTTRCAILPPQAASTQVEWLGLSGQ